jgi:hypothetical protein
MHRRTLILSAASLPLAASALADARPGAELGEVRESQGEGTLLRGAERLDLVPGLPLIEGDVAETSENGLALLWLNERTQIQMGPASSIELASFLGEVGGTITLGGAMVFDRPEDLPPLALTFVTAFGEIGVRGTRFVAGPSKGVFAVFVQRGAVEVRAGDITRRLGPGDGVDLPQDAPPGEVVQWGVPRILDAFASVGLTP